MRSRDVPPGVEIGAAGIIGSVGYAALARYSRPVSLIVESVLGLIGEQGHAD
jgi:hypothetical protein